MLNGTRTMLPTIEQTSASLYTGAYDILIWQHARQLATTRAAGPGVAELPGHWVFAA